MNTCFLKRFRILNLPSGYDIDIQARIPAALASVLNFIWEHNVTEELEEAGLQAEAPVSGNAGEVQGPSASAENGKNLRDRIAQEMWDAYQAQESSSVQGGVES